jgi:hypothetical protein
MPTIDEKRVYTDESGVETVYLASGLGVVCVSVSDDLIGEFGVRHRCHARDVAAAGPYVTAATGDDVVLCDRRAGGEDDEGADAGFRPTGFGPATAVGFRDGALLAGDGDGRVARFDPGEGDNGWTPVGTAGAVRAVDGDFLAAADGAYRIGDAGLRPVGLDDAHDVDTEPLVATGSGLYKLGNGWMDVRPGPATAVDAAEGRGLAVCDGDLYARDADAGEWVDAGLDTDAPVAAVTHGATAAYAVTETGRLAVRLPGGEWRHRSLGVDEVAAATV